MPTLFVFVIKMGLVRKPDSVNQWMPVISPFPFKLNQFPKQGDCLALKSLPRGNMAVTPVRIEVPWIIVLKPTSTWSTSVMALYLPGVPSNGIPSSLARGFFEAIIYKQRSVFFTESDPLQ